ncbi:MAG: winged helix-turn-helix domain-containing protein [Wenzhouxiangellaceae bacterium]
MLGADIRNQADVFLLGNTRKVGLDRQKIMIVDDDIHAAEMIGEYLGQHNFYVAYEFNSEHACNRVLAEQPDLLLLDILMPGIDGLSICRQIRAQFTNPIIMLTGLDEDADIITGLEVGADAYLVKPVKPRILLAHVRSLLRRGGENDDPVDANGIIRSEKLLINLRQRLVMNDGREVALTNAEFDLLAFLANQRGKVVPRTEIYRNLRRLEYNGIDRGIDLRISRLRKKLGDDPRCPRMIKTVRGVGYLFVG